MDIITILAVAGFAALNRLRGWDPVESWVRKQYWHPLASHGKDAPRWRHIVRGATSKGFTSIYSGLLAGGYGLWLGYGWQPLLVISGAVSASIYVWSAFGWGDYMDFSKKDNKEIRPIDRVVGRLLKPGFWNDTVSMGLRGLFLAPLPVLLNAWYLAPFTALQGIIYAIAHKINVRRIVPVAEVAQGILIGIITTQSILSITGG